MITITIEETDKDGQLLGRHVASAPIDKNDTKGIGSLLARSVGGLMYHTEARAEIPLLIAAAGTHRASSCTRAIGHAATRDPPRLIDQGHGPTCADGGLAHGQDVLGPRLAPCPMPEHEQAPADTGPSPRRERSRIRRRIEGGRHTHRDAARSRGSLDDHDHRLTH